MLRASSPSQPNTVTEIRYSSRNSAASDHGLITGTEETPAHHTGDEFWHGTRAGLVPFKSDTYNKRVGFQKSVTAAEHGLHATRSYSLIKPPRIGRHLIRS